MKMNCAGRLAAAALLSFAGAGARADGNPTVPPPEGSECGGQWGHGKCPVKELNAICKVCKEDLKNCLNFSYQNVPDDQLYQQKLECAGCRALCPMVYQHQPGEGTEGGGCSYPPCTSTEEKTGTQKKKGKAPKAKPVQSPPTSQPETPAK
ncbi:MAG TPA: hypothetical protein VLT85_08895 [Terriglobales bacterium]|nr:hypothetical protein [Terriglobales bacterium]